MERSGKKQGRRGGRILPGLISAFFLILADQVTKLLAGTRLRSLSGGRFVLIPDFLELQYLENRGAAFGMLQNRGWVFAVFALAVILLCWIFYMKSPEDKRFRLFRLSMILIISGAAGNLIDRMVRGYVIDFIYFSVIHFPVFNCADICVTLGVALLLILLVFTYRDDDFSWMKKG